MKKKRLQPLHTVNTDRPLKLESDGVSKALPEVEVNFSDPFAPSTAKFGSSDPNIASDPATRSLFYNDQTHEIFLDAVSKAVQLGCPSIVNGFPLTFSSVDDAFLGKYNKAIRRITPTLKEGSLDWLYVQCYVRWVSACFIATADQTDRLSVASELFFAGAAAREIELTILNRRDALRGKGTVRSASDGGVARGKKSERKRSQVIAEMKRRVTKGRAVKEASEIVARLGYGTSADANRALWYRQKPKKL